MKRSTKRIEVGDLDSCVGALVEFPIRFKGFVLVEEGEILTQSLVDKLKGIELDDSYVIIAAEKFDYSEDHAKATDLLVKNLHAKVKTVLQSYSFDDEEDVDAVEEIMQDIISSLSGYRMETNNLNTLLVSKPDLFAHSVNCAILSALMSVKSMRFQRWMIEQITLGALLHDIGMIPLLDKYTNREDIPYAELTSHPVIGYDMLKENPYIAESVKKIVLMHHIWQKPEASFNNKFKDYLSYPLEYEGKKICSDSKSLSVSIVQVADTFERMTNTSGPAPVARKEAIESILRDSKTVYGEGALLLSTYVSPYLVGDIILLSNRKKAKIVRQTSSPTRPIVQYLGRSDNVDLRKKPLIKIMGVC